MTIKIAVLRGGPSPEYDVSLRTGANVLSLLRKMPDKYEPLDIFISRDGEWHRDGLTHEPQHALSDADVAWNAMHGHFGEDGRVQKLLEYLGIPYTGSGIEASARAYDKEIAKLAYRNKGLITPIHELFTPDTLTDERIVYIVRNFMQPVVVKPASSGSSIGMKLAHGFAELKDAVKNAFAHSKKVLVEEFIHGREATCGIIDYMRGEEIYALIPTGSASAAENARIAELAKDAHRALGLRHYSSSDFIVTRGGKIYIIETDSHPALHEDSRVHESLCATGIKPHAFVDHCIRLALDK